MDRTGCAIERAREALDAWDLADFGRLRKESAEGVVTLAGQGLAAENAEGPPLTDGPSGVPAGLEIGASAASYSSSAGAPSPKPKSASGPKISASDSESTVICAATSASSRSRS